MKHFNYIKATNLQNPKSILKLMSVSFGVFFVMFMLMRFPEASAQGVSDGIDLCLGTLIPTLYPFLVVSSLLTQTGIINRLSIPFNKVTNLLFRLDGNCFGVIIMSMIGGMPVGCKMASELYENGSITRSQSRRMMLFCFCCGPAFIIGSVGIFMLSSKSAGIILYASVVLSAIIMGILSRFFEEDDNVRHHCINQDASQPFSLALVKATSAGTSAMLSICSWVVLFSCINRLVEIMPMGDSAKFFLYCILEVTNGVRISAGYLTLPLIAGIISFGGICSHCQVMPYIVKVHMKYKFFLVSRIVSAALSVIICNLLLEIFPVTYDVFAMGTLPSKTATGFSVSLSVAMMFMAGLFLLGDSTVILRNAKKDHRN